MTDILDEAKEVDEKFIDPRTMLADWANYQDEWVRFLVSEVILAGGPVGASVIDRAYKLFRQEKALDQRELPQAEQITIESSQDETAPPLTITRLSDVSGVNALMTGSIIEPNSGLTILYGENGTGKTGYSRAFKALAKSRTADPILGDINSEEPQTQTAKIEYRIGDQDQTLQWTGELGVLPFTRISIFDSPAVRTHVDDDLDYVYTPASLTLFNDTNGALQAVSSKIDETIGHLRTGSQNIVSRFQRGSTIYPIIETLGASTDLPKLKSQAKSGDSFTKELETLIQAVAALQSNTVGVQITALKSHQRVLNQARSAADALLKFKPTDYSETLDRRSQLAKDFNTFQNDLFAAADLPADPDKTWNEFIVAGDTYRKHLVEIEAHDTDRCLYCRQSLLDPAQDLLTRYSSYLEDKISGDIRTADATLSRYRTIIKGIQNSEMTAFLQGYDNTAPDEYPSYYIDIKQIEDIRSTIASAISEDQPANIEITKKVSRSSANIESVLPSVASQIEELENQQQNRSKILQEKQTEQLQLKEAIELAKCWPQIESQVQKAKEIDQLSTLKSPISTLARSVTDLAKTASDQLINQSFDEMFLEECDALRAPSLKVQFVGREGKAQRRKVLSGRHRPSKVLSEGEQKVLALADFLAEARLAGINAPVIFDDPVSSLDHRRVNEVAERIAKLSADGQVIVFTHDILFATTLLTLMEKSELCSLYLITDEDGKGKIARATGLRTDTLKAIKGRINATIQNATSMEGDMRDALVRHGYSHIRAWCEVFTEEELLKGVTRRYQPNVRMTTLSQIDGNKLNSIGPKVADIFEIACRYIDGHSQPLATLGVSPTLSGLEQHWKDLQELRSQYGQP